MRLKKKTRPAPWVGVFRTKTFAAADAVKRDARKAFKELSRGRSDRFMEFELKLLVGDWSGWKVKIADYWYGRLKALYLSAHKVCPRCGAPATDLHHTRGRVGSLYVNRAWFLPLCRACHDWAHTNVALARVVMLAPSEGETAVPLMAPEGKWGVPA